jgi:hypothetical protein
MKTVLFCIAEKYTSKPLSETLTLVLEDNVEIYPHQYARVAEETFGIRIDGRTNFLDWIVIEEDKL